MPDEYKLQIYLTRHGETWGNLPPPQGAGEDKRTERERHDPELTPLGLKQARLLGQRLSLKRFDAIFSSPLVRAVSTAFETSALQPGGNVPIELISDLREAGTPWDYPGVSWDETKKRFPCVVSHSSIQSASYWDSMEKLDEREAHMKRAENCIAFLRGRFYKGESIFIVAHGTFNTYLIRAALGLDNTNDFNFCQENTGLTKIKYFLDDKARLSYSNETSHLFSDMPGITFTL